MIVASQRSLWELMKEETRQWVLAGAGPFLFAPSVSEMQKQETKYVRTCSWLLCLIPTWKAWHSYFPHNVVLSSTFRFYLHATTSSSFLHQTLFIYVLAPVLFMDVTYRSLTTRDSESNMFMGDWELLRDHKN